MQIIIIQYILNIGTITIINYNSHYSFYNLVLRTTKYNELCITSYTEIGLAYYNNTSIPTKIFFFMCYIKGYFCKERFKINVINITATTNNPLF